VSSEFEARKASEKAAIVNKKQNLIIYGNE